MGDPILVATSTSFIIPMTYAIYHKFYYIYGSLLTMLLTSVTYHSSKNKVLLRIDQSSILHLAILSCKTGYELELLHLAVIGILWCYYVYIHGYRTNTRAFSPNYIEGQLYHGSLHVFVSGLWVYGIYVKQAKIGELNNLA